jgi:hypothetical protein
LGILPEDNDWSTGGKLFYDKASEYAEDYFVYDELKIA